MKEKRYNVYQNGKRIETVFYTLPKGYNTRKARVECVKDSLINHDNFDSNITVKETTL